MKIINKDKFTRAIIICTLLIAFIFIVKMSIDKKNNIAQLNNLQSVNETLLDAYDKTQYELDNYKAQEIDVLKDELNKQEKEIIKKQIELEEKEKELKDWEDKLDAREKEKEVLAQERKTNVASTMPTRGGVTRGKVKEVMLEVTMYTNAGGWWPKDSPNYGMMANGEFTHKGAVAGPKSLPFGTKILLDETIEGFEYLLDADLTVKDRGGKIKQKIVDGKEVYCIDIYEEDLQTALNWGRQLVPGKIIIP
jgi:3D (Asp-Asp-Asp) domain-containing protein